MSLAPSATEIQARARVDLRMGVPVVLGLADQAAVVAAAETLLPDRLAELRNLGPEPVLAITARRAETLRAVAYSDIVARVALPRDAGCAWVQAVADPADDLRAPMKGPLRTMRDGDNTLHRVAIELCKAARLLPAALVVGVADGQALAERFSLTKLDAATSSSLTQFASPMHEVVHARVPLAVSDAGHLHVFRPEDGGEEHYAVEVGRPDRGQPVLTRLHSACFTGDILGSLKCDCGPQLKGALAQMGAEGGGLLLYLNQEGRGIGLANKMRAYSLQDQGFDTVEANHRLGFEDDERDFRIGADILQRMGVERVRLLTNNPAKVSMMEAAGIGVTERVPLKASETQHNRAYLATKAKKSGHLL